MTEGVVNSAYEAIVPLSLQGPAGRMWEIETVVDTGFIREALGQYKDAAVTLRYARADQQDAGAV